MNKVLLRIIGWFLVFVLTITLLLAYISSHGFRDYKKFCSKYIIPLEQYKKKYNHYPSSLKNFEISIYDFRYNYNMCGYMLYENDFSFYFSDGYLGIWMYNSSDSKWWYD